MTCRVGWTCAPQRHSRASSALEEKHPCASPSYDGVHLGLCVRRKKKNPIIYWRYAHIGDSASVALPFRCMHDYTHVCVPVSLSLLFPSLPPRVSGMALVGLVVIASCCVTYLEDDAGMVVRVTSMVKKGITLLQARLVMNRCSMGPTLLIRLHTPQSNYLTSFQSTWPTYKFHNAIILSFAKRLDTWPCCFWLPTRTAICITLDSIPHLQNLRSPQHRPRTLLNPLLRRARIPFIHTIRNCRKHISAIPVVNARCTDHILERLAAR